MVPPHHTKHAYIYIYICKHSSYLSENTLHLRYRGQPVNAVWGNSRYLLWDHMKHTNIFRRQNAEFFNVKSDSTHCNNQSADGLTTTDILDLVKHCRFMKNTIYWDTRLHSLVSILRHQLCFLRDTCCFLSLGLFLDPEDWDSTSVRNVASSQNTVLLLYIGTAVGSATSACVCHFQSPACFLSFFFPARNHIFLNMFSRRPGCSTEHIFSLTF
jgi:hypothetical protein